MTSTTLRPPNSQLLSDDVIGRVAQRASISTLRAEPVFDESDGIHKALPVQNHLGFHQYSAAYTDEGYFLPPRCPRAKTRELTVVTRFSHAMEEETAAGAGNRLAELLIKKEAHRRELRRLKQIRYRRKKETMATQLVETTKQLRKEIKQLKAKRASISTTFLTRQSVWEIALEYFRLFRCGIQDSSTTENCPQRSFISTVMEPDVNFGTGCGVYRMLEHWSSLTTLFRDFQQELTGLAKGPPGSLIATTLTSFTITEHTLREAFPSLYEARADRKRTWRSHLADTLIGQRVVMRGRTRLDWDASQNRVSSVISEADFLTPMLGLLGNLEDASLVFESALVSPDFQLKQA